MGGLFLFACPFYSALPHAHKRPIVFEFESEGVQMTALRHCIFGSLYRPISRDMKTKDEIGKRLAI